MNGQEASFARSNKKKLGGYPLALIITGLVVLLLGLFSHAYLWCLALEFFVVPVYLIALVVFVFKKKYGALLKILLTLQFFAVFFLAGFRPAFPYVDRAKFRLLEPCYEEAAKEVVSGLRQEDDTAFLEKYTAKKYKLLARYGYELEYVKDGENIAVFFPQVSNFFRYAGYLYYSSPEAEYLTVEKGTSSLHNANRIGYENLIPIDEQWCYIYIY